MQRICREWMDFGTIRGMEKIATDTYSFERIRGGGFVYVDKTAILKTLANELPSALRIAYHGYGHAGISHVAVEDREARLVPKRVVTTEGDVLDPECVLVDDWTAVWFGCPDYHPAFLDNVLAEKRSILEVELAE